MRFEPATDTLKMPKPTCWGASAVSLFYARYVLRVCLFVTLRMLQGIVSVFLGIVLQCSGRVITINREFSVCWVFVGMMVLVLYIRTYIRVHVAIKVTQNQKE